MVVVSVIMRTQTHAVGDFRLQGRLLANGGHAISTPDVELWEGGQSYFGAVNQLTLIANTTQLAVNLHSHFVLYV